MLVFLKERRVSNLSLLYYSNANNLYSPTSIIQTLKQPILSNSQKKRRKKRRIGALDLVRSLVVLDFAICTKELKANSQLRRYRWEVVAIQTFNALQCAMISWN
jgi:hypothetical protein